MIYRIVCDGVELYGPDVEHAVLSPHLEIELNAAGSLEFTLPVVFDRDAPAEDRWSNHDIWDQPQIFKSEVEVWEEDRIIWFGRPLQITRDWNNQRRVVCEGALAYFNDSIQRTWEMKPSAKHTNVYFFYNDDNKGIINAHNGQVESNRQFTLGRVTIQPVSAYRKTDYNTTYDCIQNMCLAVDGGYILLRKEREEGVYVRYIDWLQELDDITENPQDVEFGVNLLDINQDLNGADVCTVLIATGADDSMLNNVPAVTPTEENGWIGHNAGSDEIYHQKGIEKYGRVVQTKSWSDFDAKGGVNSGLWHKATDWLIDKNTDIPTIEVSAADLHYVNNEDISEDLRSRDAFRLGTKVKVISGPHDMDRFLVIYKLSMDLDTGIKKVTLGTPPKRELTDIVAPSSGGGSTRGAGTGGNGGEGGSGSGSTYIPVKDVRIKKEEDGDYSSVVRKKIAEIDLSDVGKVNDVKVDGTSVVDEEKVANIVIPVKDIIKDGQSIVDQHGHANLEAILCGMAEPSANIGVTGDIYFQLALDSENHYYIADIWYKDTNWILYVNEDGVRDIKISGSSILDQNGDANLGSLALYFDDPNDGKAIKVKVPSNICDDQAVIGTNTINLTSISGSNDKEFDLTSNVEGKKLLEDCFEIKAKFVSDGGALYHYEPMLSFKDGIYPMFGFYINGDKVYKSQSDKTAYPNVNINARNGITIDTYVTNFNQNAEINIGYNDNYNPSYTTIFDSDDDRDLEYIVDNDVKIYSEEITLDRSGTFMAFILVNDAAGLGCNIVVNGHYPNIYYSETKNISINPTKKAMLMVFGAGEGTKVTFKSYHADDYTVTKGDVSKGIIMINNLDFGDSTLQYSQGGLYSASTSHTETYNGNCSFLVFSLDYSSGSLYGSENSFYYIPTGETDRTYIEPFFKYAKTNTSSSYNLYFENSPSVTDSKNSFWYTYYGCFNMTFMFRFPIFNTHTGYVTDSELDAAVNQLQTSFQDGVDDIYDACVAKGSTPASTSLSDVVQGIMDIPTGGGSSVVLISEAGQISMPKSNADSTISATVILSSEAKEE